MLLKQFTGYCATSCRWVLFPFVHTFLTISMYFDNAQNFCSENHKGIRADTWVSNLFLHRTKGWLPRSFNLNYDVATQFEVNLIGHWVEANSSKRRFGISLCLHSVCGLMHSFLYQLKLVSHPRISKEIYVWSCLRATKSVHYTSSKALKRLHNSSSLKTFLNLYYKVFPKVKT